MGPPPAALGPALSSFTASGFFVLRTPLLPYEALEAWWGGLEAPGTPSGGGDLEQAVERDRAVLRERLRAAFARPDLREALFVASPALEGALEAGRAGDERALVRYLTRACARPTPFGLFAGSSVGRVGSRTRLTLPPREGYRRHSRLDAEYLEDLATGLEQGPALRGAIVYRPNPTLYRAASRLRYVRARSAADGPGGERRRRHHLVALDSTRHLETALARARDGATASDLVDALRATGVAGERAGAYVAQLIDGQVLSSGLGPPLTGGDALDGFVEQLRRIPGAADTADGLEDAREALAALDAGGLGAAADRYHELERRLERLPAQAAPGKLVQVDLTKPGGEPTLGPDVVAELARAVDLLAAMARPPGDDDLSRFREAFTRRYGGAVVPLAEALDDEAGLGSVLRGGATSDSSPLLAGLPLTIRDPLGYRWERREQTLLRLLAEALTAGLSEVSLGPAELDALAAPDARPLPDALAVIAELAAPSQEALDRGEFRVLVHAVDGPSGARLLGRFCDDDAELRLLVEEHLRAEEALEPDAVFAEIVHLPADRLGNVSHRPLLRSYEIPYLGRSGAPAERQLPVDDLLVSVEDERIVVRSGRLGRRIVPRLTTAHNFGPGGLPVYRFLCRLQNENRASALYFDWGVLGDAPFLPRVRAGRLVLAPARWRLERDELRRLGAAEGAALLEATRELRAGRGLPRFVALAEADRLLPVDLECVLSLESFARLVRDRDSAILCERFAGPGELTAHGPDGSYLHQLVVPFVATEAASAGRPALRPPPPLPARFPRILPPGSDWLYAKLYAGAAAADRLLLDDLAPLVARTAGSGWTDGWFFLRFNEPELHLRVRFHGEPADLHAHVLPALEEAAAARLGDGRLRRLELDTYEREVERYGGAEGMLLAERIFRIDSEAVLAILARLEPDDRGQDERWRMALCGAARLLADFGLSGPEQLALARTRRSSLGREFGAGSAFERAAGTRFRRERERLEPLLETPDDPGDPLAPGFAAIRERSARLEPLVTELHALEAAGRLGVSLHHLASHHVHLFVNRLIRSSPRAHELVLYDFLARLLESGAARARKA